MAMLTPLRRNFDEWTSGLDPRAAIETARPINWAGMAVPVLLFIALGAWIPGTSDYIQLRAWPALLSALPIVVLLVAFWRVTARDGGMSRAAWALEMLGNTAQHFFAACLVVFSGPGGAVVFTAIFLFAATYHGLVYRATLRHPYLAVGAMAALAGATALSGSPELWARHALLLPLTGAIVLAGGHYGDVLAREREKVARMQEALLAQSLGQKQRQVNDLTAKIVGLLGVNHDVGNVLTSLAFGASTLADGLNGRDDVPRDELASTAEMVNRQLDLVSAVVREARQLVPSSGPATSEEESEYQPVALRPVIDAAQRIVRMRYPDREVRLDGDFSAVLFARGGETSVRRIVDNLLLNACEGNGRQGARKILVEVREFDDEHVRLSVVDDGPGFPPELLAHEIRGFETTKKNGSGLGLLTADSLVRASAGELRRSNEPSGGARVDVTLLRAPSSGSAKAGQGPVAHASAA
jgi:two-component system, NtrC family, C4-dicarboxylate transport sensor histidine kinase DctB